MAKCTHGTAAYLVRRAPEFANVGLNSHGRTVGNPAISGDGARNQLTNNLADGGNELPAGYCVDWRYITRDGRYVLVKDPRRHDSAGSWVFVERNALGTSLYTIVSVLDHLSAQPEQCPLAARGQVSYDDGVQ